MPPPVWHDAVALGDAEAVQHAPAGKPPPQHPATALLNPRPHHYQYTETTHSLCSSHSDSVGTACVLAACDPGAISSPGGKSSDCLEELEASKVPEQHISVFVSCYQCHSQSRPLTDVGRLDRVLWQSLDL